MRLPRHRKNKKDIVAKKSNNKSTNTKPSVGNSNAKSGTVPASPTKPVSPTRSPQETTPVKPAVTGGKPASVQAVKPIKPPSAASASSVAGNRPLQSDFRPTVQTAKGVRRGESLEPVGKNLHWLADPEARKVLRVLNHSGWMVEKSEKRHGDFKRGMQFIKGQDIELDNDDLKSIRSLRKPPTALHRDEVPDPDETVAMNAFYNEWAEILNPDSEGSSEERFRQWILEFRPDLAQLGNIDTVDLLDLVIAEGLRDGLPVGPAIALGGLRDSFEYAKAFPDLVVIDVTPLSSEQDILNQLPDAALANGRPIIILMHGTNVPNPDDVYATFYQNYEAQWAHLPPDQRPIIVGVDWASTLGATQTAEQGADLGVALSLYSQETPDSSYSIISHSLGTVLADNVVANSSTNFQNVVLIQGTLTNGELEGSALLDENRVNNLIITNNMGDGVLWIAGVRQEQVGRDGYLGSDVQNISEYTIGGGGGFLDHFGLESDDARVQAIIQCTLELPSGSSPVDFQRCVLNRLAGFR
ncbi:MAG: hypothetical protein SF123_17040 [Chloroflexota bacterium]|nr:hypothetical protein [Chloroflexota bacterium]